MTDTRDSLQSVADGLESLTQWSDRLGFVSVHKDDLRAFAARLTALQSGAGDAQVVPAGWTLVPIEPNWDMRNEGREFLIDGLEKEPEKLAYFLWKTMVAASPKGLEKRDAAIDNAKATEGE